MTEKALGLPKIFRQYPQGIPIKKFEKATHFFYLSGGK